MDGFAQRLCSARKEQGLTQNAVAEKLEVSFQAVSMWERGEATPEIGRLGNLASLLHVSTDYLLTGKETLKMTADSLGPLSDRLFDESKMYTYIKTYATAHGLYQTVKTLPYVKAQHNGQYRDGRDRVPYIYHPLLVSCQALALGLDDDDMVSAALLHDVCEDCGVKPEELPVNEETRQIVCLLTKPSGKDDASMEKYYQQISENGKATMVKLLDRCYNVSNMAAGFSPEKVLNYIAKTQKWIYPLFDTVKTNYPQYANQSFLIKYQMTSIIEALRHHYINLPL